MASDLRWCTGSFGVCAGLSRLRANQAEELPFEVLLPCIEPELNADENRVLPGGRCRATAHERATILIVEDEEPLRLAIAKMLRKSGLEVFEVASGSAAIELLRTRGGEFDLILLDLTIPGGSSQEVLARSRTGAAGREGGPHQRL